jgi:hypothetical protein
MDNTHMRFRFTNNITNLGLVEQLCVVSLILDIELTYDQT